MTTLSKIIDHDHMVKITNEFSRLKDRCYLENAGAALYPQCLLNEINEDLMNNVYMNPHTDKYTEDCIDQVRNLILRHFNTDSSNYTVVFTSGTTQSLKLVIESFQFVSDPNDIFESGSFIYLEDNHTSVVGLREIAKDKGADVIHISHEDFLRSVSLTNKSPQINWREQYKCNTLLTYPASSNFNGFKYPINCLQNIKAGCLDNFMKRNLGKINCNWYVLLDAAGYVASNRLDLSKTQPDFVALSFYKIFGYPTGLGALLVKNTSAHVLSQKRYFGGGTVDIVVSSENFHVKRTDLDERFEDGTVSFLSILALKHCFNTLYSLIPKIISDDPMETISYHTFYLGKDLYKQLSKLKHSNGNKAVVLYVDNEFTDISKQSGMVTFNLLRSDGTYIGYSEFQHMADLFNITVRTGCFCNSGACQRHLKSTNKELKEMYKAGHKCGDNIDLVKGKPTGAIRVSFGYYNTFADIDKLIMMISKCFVKNKFRRPTRVINKYKPIEEQKNKIFNVDTVKILNQQGFFKSVDLINDIPQLAESKIVLKEISIFPIKSCGAFKVKSDWKIGSKGFEYDREWMIVKDNGVCLTQKQNTRMCLIRPQIDLKHRQMTLNFKGKSSITIPLDINSENKSNNVSLCHSKVCSDLVKGFDCGDDVAQWISEVLEISCLRLIRQSIDDHRVQKKKNNEETKLLSLSNQAQFLLINKATVRWLKDKVKDPLFSDDVQQLTDRFRGNLIIDTQMELVEREWQRIIIGKHEFKVEGPCTRCQMICIDQQTGEKTVEPLRTISEQFSGKMHFGVYLTHIGTVDGSKNSTLKTNVPIKPIMSTDDDTIR